MITLRHLTLLGSALFAMSALRASGEAAAPVNHATGAEVSASGSGAQLRLTAQDLILDYTAYESGTDLVVDLPGLRRGAAPASVNGAGGITSVEFAEISRTDEEGKPVLDKHGVALPPLTRMTIHRGAKGDFRTIKLGPQLVVVTGPYGSLPAASAEGDSRMNAAAPSDASGEKIGQFTALTEIPVPAAVTGSAQIEFTVPDAAPVAIQVSTRPVEPVSIAAVGKRATRLLDMRWTPNGLELIADGALAPRLFHVENPTRLAIDLPGVVTKSRNRQITVNQNGVRAARAAQNSLAPEALARVVLDLDQPVVYEAVSTSNGALIRIGTSAAPVVVEPVLDSHPAVNDALQASVVSPAAEPAPVLSVVAPLAPAVVTAAPVEIRDVDQNTANALFAGSEMATVPTEVRRQLRTQSSLYETADSGSAQLAGGGTSGRGHFTTKTLEDPNVRYTGKPITFTFKDADVLDVIRYFHEISHLNFIVHPAVKGPVTVNLENVPWDQAMDVILRNLGYDYIYSHNVIWIAPQSEIVNQQKAHIERMKLIQDVEQPVTKVKRVSYAKALDLKAVLSTSLTKKGSIVVDERTNQLIMSEIPSNFGKIEKLLALLDVPAAQVRIEARVVEANANFSETFGISFAGRWAPRGVGFADSLNPTKFAPLEVDGYPLGIGSGFPETAGQFGAINPGTATSGFLNFILSNASGSFQLDTLINAQEARGRAKLLSSPSISVEDNSQAEIRAGQEFAFVTCGGQSCTLTTKEAVLNLKIKPQITSDGNVAMDIDISNDRLDLANFRTAGASSSLPIFRRKAVTRLKVRDGDTAVIGGISSVDEGIAQSGVPVLSKVPVLGWLFKNRTRSRANAELLIFITPKILR